MHDVARFRAWAGRRIRFIHHFSNYVQAERQNQSNLEESTHVMLAHVVNKIVSQHQEQSQTMPARCEFESRDGDIGMPPHLIEHRWAQYSRGTFHGRRNPYANSGSAGHQNSNLPMFRQRMEMFEHSGPRSAFVKYQGIGERRHMQKNTEESSTSKSRRPTSTREP